MDPFADVFNISKHALFTNKEALCQELGNWLECNSFLRCFEYIGLGPVYLIRDDDDDNNNNN